MVYGSRMLAWSVLDLAAEVSYLSGIHTCLLASCGQTLKSKA